MEAAVRVKGVLVEEVTGPAVTGWAVGAVKAARTAAEVGDAGCQLARLEGT